MEILLRSMPDYPSISKINPMNFLNTLIVLLIAWFLLKIIGKIFRIISFPIQIIFFAIICGIIFFLFK